MTIKDVVINNQICQFYFYMPANEVDEIFAQMVREKDDLDIKSPKDLTLLKELARFTFETLYLMPELSSSECITFGDFKIRYYTDIELNRPILGTAYACILPDLTNIVLPRIIPGDAVDLNNFDFEAFYQKLCYATDCFRLEKVKTATKNTVVEYDLRYTKDGNIINTIKDLSFDMGKDKDLDPKLFKNAKVGDVVILASDDGVYVEAYIKNIFRKVAGPFDDVAIKTINLYQAPEDAFDFTKYVFSLFELKHTIDQYISFILEFALENSTGIINDELLEFIYSQSTKKYKNIDEAYQQIKLSIMLDCIDTIIDYKDEDYEIGEEDYYKIQNLIKLVQASSTSNNYNAYDEEYEKKYRVLKYCQENNIIHNLKI